MVFYISASVYIFGNSIFLLFGTSVEQDWNNPLTSGSRTVPDGHSNGEDFNLF